jgi:hypothetical protein
MSDIIGEDQPQPRCGRITPPFNCTINLTPKPESPGIE